MTEKRMRADIQFLRFVAVSMVTLFHFWPGRLTGGFAGVDVFFVISGFLITGSLFGSVVSGQKIDLLKFWSGRIKRLIPAALLVSFTTLAAVMFLVPSELRLSTVKQFLPSSLYFENIQLQNDTVDYFADTNSSAFQHYWSLSVEEQFYIVWPIIIGAIALAAWGLKRKAAALKASTVLLVALSFTYGVVLTATSPAMAYFDSFTRAWEFGLGAAVAIFKPKLPKFLSLPTFISGIALLAVGSFVFTDKMHFPGLYALVPTIGAALVIVAELETGPFAKLTGLRPFQFAGNHSYGIYLWHWPVLVIATYLLGHRPGTALLLVGLGVTILLAWVSKRFVEDPIRYSKFKITAQPKYVLGALAASVVVSLTFSGVTNMQTNNEISQHAKDLAKQVASNSRYCLGAESLKSFGRNCKSVPTDLRIPKNYLQVQQITPGAIWTNECRVNLTERAFKRCEFGNPMSTITIALVGDSHAASWFPAILSVAKSNHWKLLTYYKSGCTLAIGIRSDTVKGKASSCQWWETKVLRDLDSKPVDLVVVGYARASLNIQPTNGETALQANVRGLSAMLSNLGNKNVAVIGIRDNPIPGHSLKPCLIKNQSNVHLCDMKRAEVVRTPDPMKIAVGQNPNAVLADFTDYFCSDTICPALVGGLYPYKDDDHVVATYVRTLSPVWQTLISKTLMQVEK